MQTQNNKTINPNSLLTDEITEKLVVGCANIIAFAVASGRFPQIQSLTDQILNVLDQKFLQNATGKESHELSHIPETSGSEQSTVDDGSRTHPVIEGNSQ